MLIKISIPPNRFKNAKTINKLNNQQIADLIGFSKATVDDIVRKGTFDESMLNKLCSVLDCSPEYLLGKESVPAEEIYLDALALRKKAFFKKYSLLDDAGYNAIRSRAKTRIDPDGLFMHSYTEYITERAYKISFAAFRKWLMSINLTEVMLLEENLGFPTNKELQTIVEKMDDDQLFEFWDSMVDSVYDYLLRRRLIHDFNKNATEAEKDERFIIKFNDVEETRRKEV